MHSRFDENDAMTDLMERRWFAMNSAASRLQEDCIALAEAVEVAESAWRGARSRLKNLETLRDALGDELARRHADADRKVPVDRRAAVTSAA